MRKAFMFPWCCPIQMEVRTQKQTTNLTEVITVPACTLVFSRFVGYFPTTQ